MNNDLKSIKISPKNGKESFCYQNRKLDFSLSDFWSWAQSGLLNNALRGILAEFLVKKALDIQKNIRTEWDAFDLQTEEGLKIEVKSAAYLQSWSQNKLSHISFDISESYGWNSETNDYSKELKRQSDIYIFCLLHYKDKKTVNPMLLEQWTFYLLPTKILNQQKKNQKRIGLASLLKLNPIKCSFEEIRAKINSLL